MGQVFRDVVSQLKAINYWELLVRTLYKNSANIYFRNRKLYYKYYE